MFFFDFSQISILSMYQIDATFWTEMRPKIVVSAVTQLMAGINWELVTLKRQQKMFPHTIGYFIRKLKNTETAAFI